MAGKKVLFLVLRVSLAIWNLLCFHVNFKIVFSILTRITMNLHIILDAIVMFILILLSNDTRRSFHLLYFGFFLVCGCGVTSSKDFFTKEVLRSCRASFGKIQGQGERDKKETSLFLTCAMNP